MNLFAVEKLNFVVEDAQLLEMTAFALSTSIPHWTRTGGNLRRLQHWTTQQLRLCVRCLQDLRDDTMVEGVQGDGNGAGLRPVGGWTFDESTFLHVYACALLTTALVQVSRVTGAWSAEIGHEAQGEEVASAVKALLRVEVDKVDNQSLLHPVLRSTMQQLMNAFSCNAGELREWLTFGCVSGVLLNARAQ
jgi:hypothetical protein